MDNLQTLKPFDTIAWVLLASFWTGAVVGSFLNVLIYRLPRGLSIIAPKNSYCPSCQHRLNFLDLIPVLSYLMMRGQCRHCQKPISPLYLLIEIITGVLWSCSAWCFLLASWDPGKALLAALFLSFLVAIFTIDFQTSLIPDSLNICLLALGVIYNFILVGEGRASAMTGVLPSSWVGAWLGVFVLGLIAALGRFFFGRDAMGHGDIKMARGMGSFLFVFGLLSSLGIAVLLGALVGIFQLALVKKSPQKGKGKNFQEPEPYGSILKSILGYLLLIDVVGYFFPAVNKWWFGYGSEEFQQELDVNKQVHTDQTLEVMPFGPFLAIGAAATIFFEPKLHALWNAYLAFLTR